jgi:hypothetical protein
MLSLHVNMARGPEASTRSAFDDVHELIVFSGSKSLQAHTVRAFPLKPQLEYPQKFSAVLSNISSLPNIQTRLAEPPTDILSSSLDGLRAQQYGYNGKKKHGVNS